MGHPRVYRWWQAPFARSKFAPIERHNRLTEVRRVLDVGCGPGTNAARFAAAEYVGLDHNPGYIEAARKDFPGTFLVADARTFAASGERFDFILVNSLLHHIDTENVQRILHQLHDQLTPDGHIHVLDLVLPPRPSIARFLARSDRGDHPRPLARWVSLFRSAFTEVVLEPYSLRGFGIDLWNMIYFKGRAKNPPVDADPVDADPVHP